MMKNIPSKYQNLETDIQKENKTQTDSPVENESIHDYSFQSFDANNTMELFQYADNDKVIYRTAELRSWSKRPYECNHCPFKCDSNTFLNNHIKSVHDIKRSYSCSFCARNFSRKENLKRHIKSLHTHCAKSRLLKIFSVQYFGSTFKIFSDISQCAECNLKRIEKTFCRKLVG